MSSIALIPSYMPNILFFYNSLLYSKIVFNVDGLYKKQTYRNRTYICGPNSLLKLIIPIESNGKSSKRYKDIRVSKLYDWQKNHWKTISNSYRKAPFFEFYESKIYDFYSKKYKFLVDVNIDSTKLIYDFVKKPFNYSLYDDLIGDTNDFSSMVDFKGSKTIKLPKYSQIFSDRYPFVSNLSMMDLIFCVGDDISSYFSKIEKEN